MMDFLTNLGAWILMSKQGKICGDIVLFACVILPIVVVISNRRMTRITTYIIVTGLIVVLGGTIIAVPSQFAVFSQKSRYAHQETVKPYQYVLGKDDQFYYKMSKNGKTYHDYYGGTETKVSDHTGTAIYGKKWVANKNATKYERQFVKQQDIEWHKVEYRKAAD